MGYRSFPSGSGFEVLGRTAAEMLKPLAPSRIPTYSSKFPHYHDQIPHFSSIYISNSFPTQIFSPNQILLYKMYFSSIYLLSVLPVIFCAVWRLRQWRLNDQHNSGLLIDIDHNKAPPYSESENVDVETASPHIIAPTAYNPKERFHRARKILTRILLIISFLAWSSW